MILGSLGFSQDAHAATRIFTTDTTITSNETIGAGESWQINPEVTVIINAGVTITNLNFITNSGTIKNFGTIVNIGTISNESNGTIINSGTINNSGTILNFGTIILVDGGSITSGGTIRFQGTIVAGGCGSGTILSGIVCVVNPALTAQITNLQNIILQFTTDFSVLLVQPILDLVNSLVPVPLDAKDAGSITGTLERSLNFAERADGVACKAALGLLADVDSLEADGVLMTADANDLRDKANELLATCSP